MRRNTPLIAPGLIGPGFLGPGVMRRSHCASLLFLALLASGCSGTSLLGTPSTTATDSPPPASSSPSFKDKFSSFFSSSSATSQQSVAGAAQDIDCALINIRPG